MNIHKIELKLVEIEQLIAISDHGLTSAGDLISKEDTKSLVKKGLVSKLEGYYCLTESGFKYMRLLYKYMKIINP